jgi:GDP-4-dehydro-6-deoxy-D-mannose reductase
MADFKRILLTGGGGFVGSHLSAALAASYPEASRKVVTRPGEEEPLGAVWTPIVADLTDAAAIDAAVAAFRPDLVLHLAGQASVGQAVHAAEQTWRVNFHGSFNLASALARHARETTVLFSSSATVYGLTLRDGVATEDAPLRPLDAYSRSKAAAEGAFADVLANEARLIVARPVNHTGPRQHAKNFALSSFAAQIAAIESGRAEPRLKVGDLTKARDFLDVRDVVDAYQRLIRAARDLPDRVSVFNVASGEPRTIRSLLDGLRARSTRPFAEEVDESLLRPSQTDIACVACDAARLREATGWRPRHSVDDMLQSLLDYWRDVERGAAQ